VITIPSRFQVFSRCGVSLVLGLLLYPEPCHTSDQVKEKSHSDIVMKRVVVMGDSLAAGFGIDPDQSFPRLLQKKVDSLDWPFAIINAGVSGDTSAGGLRRIRWLLKKPVDVLILELGGNDGLRGLDVKMTGINLQGIIDRTREKYPKARIIIAGMRMPPNLGATYTRKFERIFKELAHKNGARLIPFLLEGVGGKPELNLPDRIHPTAEGHRIIGETVWKYLKPVLRETMHPARSEQEKTEES